MVIRFFLPQKYICFLQNATIIHQLCTKNLLLLQGAGATLKLKNCKFFRNLIYYLGHVFCSRRLELDFHTTDAILGLSPSTAANRGFLVYF